MQSKKQERVTEGQTKKTNTGTGTERNRKVENRIVAKTYIGTFYIGGEG
jgi:hypothetical protein